MGELGINISEDSNLLDGDSGLLITGAETGSEVRISLSMTDSEGTEWRSENTYVADGDGVVDTHRMAPQHGSYNDVDPNGPYWSMTPDGRTTPVAFTPTIEDLAYQIQVATDTAHADITVTRGYLAEVTSREVYGQGFHATIYTPRESNGAAVLVVPGTTGRAASAPTAALLASHGYHTMVVAYAIEEGLPPVVEEIPVEVLVTALDVLLGDSHTEAKNASMIGYSVGTEGVLAALAYTDLRIGSAIVVSPSSCIWQATGTGGRPPKSGSWTLAGKPLTWLKMKSERLLSQLALHATIGRVLPRKSPLSALDLIKSYGPAIADDAAYEAAAIAVEDISCPLLMLASKDDHMWPSVEMVNRMTQRREKAGRASADVYKTFEGAGHFLRPPVMPTTIPWTSDWIIGGQPKETAQAYVQAWADIEDFLLHTIRPT